jgi:hydroxymethylbilane synthase
MADRIAQVLPPEFSLPAGGQGAVGIEVRTNDARVADLLAPLHHLKTAQCVIAERAMNRRLEGGCQVPIACYAIQDPNNSDQIWLRALVGDTDGSRILRAEMSATPDSAEQLGLEVAENLLAQGAGDILAAVMERGV